MKTNKPNNNKSDKKKKKKKKNNMSFQLVKDGV